MKLIFTVAFLLFSFLGECAAEKVKIIFDSDMCGNHDDMGAIAVLHSLSMSGEAEILATITSVDGVCWECASRCMMATNAYYGREDIPVGRVRVAVRDPALYFGVEKRGSLHFTTGSKYTWDFSSKNDNHSYVTPRNGFAEVEAIIEDLMADERRAK